MNPQPKHPIARHLAVLLAIAAAALSASACGTTVTQTVTQPPSLGPARGEGGQPQPKQPGPGPAYRAASGCGIERWAVKTGTDPSASSVNPTPQDSTISQLGTLAAPVNPTDRVAPVETTVYRISGTVTAIKQEGDSDYHLALTDGQGHTMIAESPDPSCAAGSVFAAQLAQVRATISQACPTVGPSYQDVSIPAELTGIGFFDRLHGQRGVAPNGIELHPLLNIALNGHC